MPEHRKEATDIERRRRKSKRSNDNEANRPRDTSWNRVFSTDYSTYMSLSRAVTGTKIHTNQTHSLRKAEYVCVSPTSNILTDLSRHKCNTQVKQSDYYTTKTGEQMVSIANTEGRPDTNYYLRRGNAHGELEREDAPPSRPPKSKYKAYQSLRRWIESGDYIEFLRRREHGGWNWFGQRKRRKKSPSHLKIGSRTRGCTNSQSSDREVQVQPVIAEADYAGGIDAVIFNRRLKSLLVDNSEPSFEKLIRLSCELENYITLRRGKMKEELSMASTKVADTDETPWDRPSSLLPNRAYSPDDAEQRTSVNSRFGHQSLTENANASAPQSVRTGGSSVRSPRLTLSISISSISSAERVSEGANKKERKGCFGRGKKKNEDANKRDLSRASKRTSILANTANTKSMTSTNTGDSAGRKSTNNQKDRGCCGRGKKKNEDKTDQDLSSKHPSQMSTGSRRSKQSSFFSNLWKSPSKRVTTPSAPRSVGSTRGGGGGVGGQEKELEVRKGPPCTAELSPPVPPIPQTPVSAPVMPVHIQPSPNNVQLPAYQDPKSQRPAGMQCCCTMCPIHCMALQCPQTGQSTMNQPKLTSPPPTPPAPMTTSPKVTPGATMDCTSHMGKVQSPDQATTAISVEPPNGPSSQPIVHMTSSDITEKGSAPLTAGRSTGASTHTIEIKFHGERMSSVTVASTKADSNQPAASAIEQCEGTKSSASPATFRSDMPAAAATSRSLSRTSEGSRLSKLSGGSSDADGEQESGKGCCGKGYCKKKPEAKHNDLRTSRLFDRSASKASTNTEGSLTPGGKRPSQRRSTLSCYKKQTSEKAKEVTGRAAQAKSNILHPTQRRSMTSCYKKGAGQKTLRLTNAYMSDDGRKPEFAQSFEYPRCRSASYGMAAPYENGLPGARMQAQLHTVAVNPQPSRFTCVSAGVDKATRHQPAFHSAVTDFTEQNEATRPWMPRRPDGRSPDDVCSPTPTADTRFIVGERPVSPAGAGQTVMVNTQENSLASPCNGTIVECSMEPAGFGQQSQPRCKCAPICKCISCPRMRPPGPNSFMAGPGQAVWVLMPMPMGANGMVGMPAPCACHGRR